MAEKTVTLYSLEGEKYETSSPVEITRLKAHGYSETAPATSDDADYRDMQTRAKELGIPANQSKDALAAAIADAE